MGRTPPPAPARRPPSIGGTARPPTQGGPAGWNPHPPTRRSPLRRPPAPSPQNPPPRAPRDDDDGPDPTTGPSRPRRVHRRHGRATDRGGPDAMKGSIQKRTGKDGKVTW